MKVMICIPSYDIVDVPFVRSLIALEHVGETSCNFMTGSLVSVSRDNLAAIAIGNDTDYVLWLDSDMTFEPNLLKNLLKDIEEKGCDIVTALAFRRQIPYNPAIYKKIRMGATAKECITENYDDYPENSLFEIDACGMAGCLMKTKVLKDIIDIGHTAFMPIPGYGEDISFCIRARKLGYKIFCDSSVKMGHITETVVTETTFKGFKF